MKLTFALLALATSVIASDIAEKRWKDKTSTKLVYTTTTICPATTTKYEGGHTSVVTYLTTSTIVVTDCHNCETTVALPDTTKYVPSEVFTTLTTPCPVTETKTVGGKEVYVTYTVYSTITKAVPTTVIDYTTSSTTCYETTEVIQTESVAVTKYTTVSAHRTIVITESITSTIDVTLYYTITSTFAPLTTKATVIIPVTEISSEAVTRVTTIPSEKTITKQGTVESVVSYTIVKTIIAPVPTTTLPPTTIITSVAVSSTSIVPQNTTTTSTSTSAAPPQFTANSATENHVGSVAVLAGAGIMAFLALI